MPVERIYFQHYKEFILMALLAFGVFSEKSIIFETPFPVHIILSPSSPTHTHTKLSGFQNFLILVIAFYNLYTYGFLCIHLAKFPLVFLNMSLFFKKLDKFHIFSAYAVFYFLPFCQLRDHIIPISDSFVSVLISRNVCSLSSTIFSFKLH